MVKSQLASVLAEASKTVFPVWVCFFNIFKHSHLGYLLPILTVVTFHASNICAWKVVQWVM